ncbi:MAG: long-subunit acyl-CoA synthetase (AMP-forming) [Myxococcota bacterium]
MPATLVHQLSGWAASRPDHPALVALNADGAPERTSWSAYWQAVQEVGRGLLALGHEPGEAVAIVGCNRKEWLYCELAIMAVGGVPAPIYVTNTREQVAYIVRHSRARIVICDDATQLAKLQSAREHGELEVAHLVTMDALTGDRVMSLDDLRALGDADPTLSDRLDARVDALDPHATALLIYTSGTTGVPKGAQLTHAGMVALSRSLTARYTGLTPHPETQEARFRVVSYLPLCHVAEQAMTNFLSLELGGEVWLCPDLTRLKDHLLAARPTVFMAVPRVWEKFQAALEARFAEATGVKAWLARWARRTELAGFTSSLLPGAEPPGLSRRLARRLVISRVRAALGLDQLVVAASGAAPISRSTLDFFASIGIVIHEAYGMTETTGIATVPPLGRPRFGTVGQALEGVELRIADDGEVLLRGPTMTAGYQYMEEQTAELLGADGWLHTGDLGSLDADGFLSITGRKKDILITAGGKNIAPVEIEAHLQGLLGVGQAVVVGDRQPYLCALLVLDPEALEALASAAGVPAGTLPELAVLPALRAHLEAQVEAVVNPQLARYQTVKKIRIVPAEFSVETGELTPTMKVKRAVVTENWAALIAEMYA